MVTIRNSASPVTRATAEMEEKRRTCLDYISFAVALRSALRCQLIPVSSVVHIYFSVTRTKSTMEFGVAVGRPNPHVSDTTEQLDADLWSSLL